MRVSVRLRRIEQAATPEAFFLPTFDAAVLVDNGIRLGGFEWPLLYPVADGCLIVVKDLKSQILPGAIRLRQRAPNLYIPVDAEIVPALLDDEARGLTLRQGLIFLPPDRILSFDPTKPLAVCELLGVGSDRRRDWRPLPAPPAFADQITAIELALPEDGDPLEGAGNEIGTESARPDLGSMLGATLGSAALSAGKALVVLGRLLHLRRLARLGARWIDRAAKLAPRLTEAIFGAQEAALRNLLRHFQEGRLEEALRRALPLGSEGDRGGSMNTGVQLPWHKLAYSLSNLLGGAGGGGGYWCASSDIQLQLMREYTKAANQAIERGDYRRAAFIFAKLLRDYRQAAYVLMQGGLHHDAAILYLNVLQDRWNAACAFAAAGEIDRALQLYRQMDKHVEAGDLLRRIGEEEAALAEFKYEAERLAADHKHLAAAEIMTAHAGRPDLAEEYLRRGWADRPGTNAFACAIRLAETFAEQRSVHSLLHLMAEGRECLAEVGHDQEAEMFYNRLAKLAEHPGVAEARADLRDQALVGLAVKMDQRIKAETQPGPIVSMLVGRTSVWSRPQVGDAEYAIAEALNARMENERPPFAAQVRLGDGPVTAVCYAFLTGEVFVSFRRGEIVCFQPAGNQVTQVKNGNAWSVLALATTPSGESLNVLQHEEKRWLIHYAKVASGVYQRSHLQQLCTWNDTWLTPMADGCDWVGMGRRDDGVHMLSLASGRSFRVPIARPLEWYDFGMLFPRIDQAQDTPALLLFSGGGVDVYPSIKTLEQSFQTALGWQPRIPLTGEQANVPLAWFQNGVDFDVAGFDEHDCLRLTRLRLLADQPEILLRAKCKDGGKYQIVTIVRPGVLAAVSKQSVDWLKVSRQGIKIISSIAVELPRAVACCHSYATQELLIVSRDGMLNRVPSPF